LEAELVVDEALGENSRADELRTLTSALEMRRATLARELAGTPDAAARKKIEKLIRQVDEQNRNASQRGFDLFVRRRKRTRRAQAAGFGVRSDRSGSGIRRAMTMPGI